MDQYYSKYTLPNNNLDLYVFQDFKSPVVYAVFVIDVGKIDEPKDKSGITSVIEQTLLSRNAINTLFTAGIRVSTEVSLCKTKIKALMHPKSLDLFFHIVLNELKNFDSKNLEFLEQYKKYILLKRNIDSRNSIRWLVQDYALLLFDNKGRESFIDGINNLTKKDVLQFYNDCYFNSRISIYISGACSQKKACSLINNTFNQLKMNSQTKVCRYAKQAVIKKKAFVSNFANNSISFLYQLNDIDVYQWIYLKYIFKEYFVEKIYAQLGIRCEMMVNFFVYLRPYVCITCIPKQNCDLQQIKGFFLEYVNSLKEITFTDRDLYELKKMTKYYVELDKENVKHIDNIINFSEVYALYDILDNTKLLDLNNDDIRNAMSNLLSSDILLEITTSKGNQKT